MTGWLAVLSSGAREKPRPAFRQKGFDWPRGPAQRQLPTAGRVEGACSQGVKLQTLCNMDTPDTSLCGKQAQPLSPLSVVIAHDYV